MLYLSNKHVFIGFFLSAAVLAPIEAVSKEEASAGQDVRFTKNVLLLVMEHYMLDAYNALGASLEAEYEEEAKKHREQQLRQIEKEIHAIGNEESTLVAMEQNRERINDRIRLYSRELDALKQATLSHAQKKDRLDKLFEEANRDTPYRHHLFRDVETLNNAIEHLNGSLENLENLLIRKNQKESEIREVEFFTHPDLREKKRSLDHWIVEQNQRLQKRHAEVQTSVHEYNEWENESQKSIFEKRQVIDDNSQQLIQYIGETNQLISDYNEKVRTNYCKTKQCYEHLQRENARLTERRAHKREQEMKLNLLIRQLKNAEEQYEKEQEHRSQQVETVVSSWENDLQSLKAERERRKSTLDLEQEKVLKTLRPELEKAQTDLSAEVLKLTEQYGDYREFFRVSKEWFHGTDPLTRALNLSIKEPVNLDGEGIVHSLSGLKEYRNRLCQIVKDTSQDSYGNQICRSASSFIENFEGLKGVYLSVAEYQALLKTYQAEALEINQKSDELTAMYQDNAALRMDFIEQKKQTGEDLQNREQEKQNLLGALTAGLEEQLNALHMIYQMKTDFLNLEYRGFNIVLFGKKDEELSLSHIQEQLRSLYSELESLADAYKDSIVFVDNVLNQYTLSDHIISGSTLREGSSTSLATPKIDWLPAQALLHEDEKRTFLETRLLKSSYVQSVLTSLRRELESFFGTYHNTPPSLDLFLNHLFSMAFYLQVPVWRVKTSNSRGEGSAEYLYSNKYVLQILPDTGEFFPVEKKE